MKQEEIFESGMKQNMEEIFKTVSPEAKQIQKLKEQIKEGKEQIKVLKKLYGSNSQEFIDESHKFLQIFLTKKDFENTKDKLQNSSEKGILSYCYSVLVNKMDKLEKIQQELDDTLAGI